MNRVIIRRFAIALVLAALLSISLSVVSQPEARAADTIQTSQRGRIIGDDIPYEGRFQDGTDGIRVDFPDDEILKAVVVLESPSVLDTAPALPGTAVSSNSIDQVRFDQENISNIARSRGIEVNGSTQVILNSISVRGSREQLRLLSELPGVEGVYRVPDMVFHNAEAIPYMGVAAFWEQTGNYGQGMTIAIIDSGINYEHANFGNCTFDGVNFNGANCKVVGGYDFWADEPDPMDCNPANPGAFTDNSGHGTHVAGSAAGYGVNGGSTYLGPYNASTPFSTMDIGPGVAPGADILAYRVGDCTTGINSLVYSDPVLLAIERAFLDGADVANLSLGGNYGGSYYDSVIETVSQAGMVVVASAGNDGDEYFITGAPATAPHAISVAAFQDDSSSSAIVDVNSPFTDTYLLVGASSFGPTLATTGPITGNLVLASPALNGCTAEGGITNDMTGQIALIRRGACNFTEKVENAQAQGAIAVVMWDFTNGGVITPGGTPVGLITIPSVLIGNAEGQALEDAVNAGGANVTLTADTAAGRLALFTSRGPRRMTPDYPVLLKPDLGAVGENVQSSIANDTTNPAEAGDPIGQGGPPFDNTASGTLGGTSMSSPMVAGGAALLMQTYGWDVQTIKAYLMNTAVDVFDVDGLTRQGPSRVGAGFMDFNNILLTQGYETIAYDATYPEVVGVSFGFVEVADTYSDSRAIQVENVSGTARTYTVRFETVRSNPGVSITPSQGTVSVGANGTTTFNIGITADASQMLTAPLDPTSSLQNHFISEVNGYVILEATDGMGSDLRVPVNAIVRRASDMQADGDVALLPGQTQGSAPLYVDGTPLSGSGDPTDPVSLMTAFNIIAENPADVSPGFSDIRYVGVASNYGTVPPAEEELYIAVVMEENWATPSDIFLELWFDLCGDTGGSYGTDGESVYFNFYDSNSPNSFIHVRSDVLYLGTGDFFFLDDEPINIVDPNTTNTYLLGNNVMIMKVEMSWLRDIAEVLDLFNQIVDGTPSEPRCYGNEIDFYMLAYEFDDVFARDYVGIFETITFDYTQLPFSFQDEGNLTGSGPYTGLTYYEDVPGAFVPVDFDLSSFATPADYPDILLLHHHNDLGTRYERVNFTIEDGYDLASAKSVDNDVPNEGDTVVFTLEATNAGPAPVDQVVIADSLPIGLTYNGYETCTTQGGTFTPGVPGGAPFVCEFPPGDTLPAGFAANFQIGATVDAGTFGTTLLNRATVSTNNTTLTNLSALADSADINICVGGNAETCNNPSFSLSGAGDVSLNVSGEFDPGAIGLLGEGATWTISATNNSSAALTNVVITMNTGGYNDMLSMTTTNGTVTLSALPEGFDAFAKLSVTAALEGRSSTSAATIGSVVIPVMAAGETVTITVDAQIIGTPPSGLFTLMAVMTADGGLNLSATGTLPGVGALPNTGYPPAEN